MQTKLIPTHNDPAYPGTAGKLSLLLSVFRVTSGNCLEMYDFMIFGYYAKWIARAFFPLQSEGASLLLTFATFGSGFLMRPLGALVLGGYTDRHGRRAGLLLTLGLMAFGTFTIACTPAYARIGIVAPIVVLIGRLVQGLSAGAELGTVSVYLSEIAPPGEKGFYVSWQSASQQLSVIAAALFGIIMVKWLAPSTMDSWGWRIPLWFGCAAIPFLFWIRTSLSETAEFANRKHTLTGKEILSSMTLNWRVISIGTLFTTLTTTAFYLITAYTPTYGASALHLTQQSALIVTLCVGLCNFLCLPIMGYLSDRVGRRPLLWACPLFIIGTAYPLMTWLVHRASFSRLLGVELWFAILYATYNAAMVVYLTEIMPPDVRASSFSFAYSTATALFGGFTPLICTYLIQVTGNKAIPGAWLSVSALLALSAVAFTYLRSSLARKASYP